MFTNASFIEEFRQLCKKCPALQSMYVTGAISTNKYLPKWFKWKNAYYSLLHNQPCCIYKKCKDNKCKIACRYMDVAQKNEYILYFNSAFEFKQWYIEQLYTT